jgi:hypothetical protein
MAVIKQKGRGKMRLWVNLRYLPAGVGEHYKKINVSVPGPRFESDTTQTRQKHYGFRHCHIMSYYIVPEAHTRRFRNI